MPVRITLNGEEQRLETALTVAQLLESLGLTGQRVAVEVNREIVPRSRHADAKLQDNDRVEVVRAIGGGSGMSRRAGAPRSGDATSEDRKPPTTGGKVL